MIIVGGYRPLCDPGDLTSTGSFGDLEQKLQSQSLQVVYFSPCAYSGKPRIEDLGSALGSVITGLRVPQVDLISLSMGGLVVRSYLAGKQVTAGAFSPPPDPKIRKWVSIATPNFGALFGGFLAQFAPDEQAREMLPDSQFVFDLATWNQGHDDLRGIDALAIVGNGGGFGPLSKASDGLVPVTSASLSFAQPDQRTRIIPYCHSDNDLVNILGGGCSGPPLAKVSSDDHLSYRIIESFLSGSDEWKSIGHAPSEDPILSRLGGIIRQQRNSANVATSPIENLDFVQAPVPGTYSVVIDKPGPNVYLTAPAAARLNTLSLAPRMIVAIYGNQLDAATVSAGGQPLQLFYDSARQINALLPANISGRVMLAVSNPQGQYATNLLVEDAAPAVFSLDGSGTGAAAAIRTGNFISLYLTGLGTNGNMPSVLINGIAATVTYAGPAPGFPGLDQINIAIPPALPSGVRVPLIVQSGHHISNTTFLTP